MSLQVDYSKRVFEWLFALALITTASALAAVATNRMLDKSMAEVSNPILELANQVKEIARTVVASDVKGIDGSSGFNEVELLRSSVGIFLNKIGELKKELIAIGQSQGRQDLAAQVVHDLRVPLTALQTILNRELVTPKEDLPLLKQAAARLGIIADDLLQAERTRISTAADQQNQEEMTSCFVAETVRSAFSLAEISTLKQIGFELDISTSAETVTLTLPPTFLERALFNLLGNAIEATPDKGLVKIEVNSSSETVRILVRDNGKGIPSSVISQIGARGLTFGKEKGTGLGLHYVKSNVEKYGGTFSVISSMSGTTVELSFPIPPQDLCTQDSLPRTVVLIDDDALVRETWQSSAAHYNWNLLSFSSPEDFFSTAMTMSKSVALYFDLRLSSGNGVEAGEKAKQLGFTELYLATGIPKNKLEGLYDLSCFRDVVGKTPPWERLKNTVAPA